MPSQRHLVLPGIIVLVCVIVIVGVSMAATVVSRSAAVPRYTPDPDATTAHAIIPRPPVPPHDSRRTTPKAPCLPSSSNFTALSSCTRQSDCDQCSETDTQTPMACVHVSGAVDANHDNDAPRLVKPLNVDVRGLSPADGGGAAPPPCSGHGQLDDATGECVCTNREFLNDKGECTAPDIDGNSTTTGGVCFSGDQCEVTTFSVRTPGSFCLPAHTNQCDMFTSTTVLAPGGGGVGDNTSRWACECKPSMQGLFRQEVEGGDCSTPLVCGPAIPPAPNSTLASHVFVNTGTVDTPTFQRVEVADVAGLVPPMNRVTSHFDGDGNGGDGRDQRTNGAPCAYKTSGWRDGGEEEEKGEEVQPYNGEDGIADPTCKPRLFSNKCTLIDIDKQFQISSARVVRGSGAPGDPLLTRVAPPYPRPVPPLLQRCPDGWWGDNTRANPCTPPHPTSVIPFAFISSTPQPGAPASWLPPSGATSPGVTSVDTLRTWWAEHKPDDATWHGLDTVTDVDCVEPYYPLPENPDDNVFCIDKTDCTAALGWRARTWDGDRDGPLVDETSWLPYWRTTSSPTNNVSFGGQCTCDAPGMVPSSMLLEPGQTTDSTFWQCVPDPCATLTIPDGRLVARSTQSVMFNNAGDGAAQYKYACDCPVQPAEHDGGIVSGVSYKHPTQPPTCIRDPCNPHGVVNRPAVERRCADDDACQSAGVCIQSACYLKPAEGDASEPCDTSQQCDDPDKVCHEGTCVALDPVRATMGTRCTNDAQCSLGACNPEGLCTGGCACKRGYHQGQADGTSPLGVTCVSDCATLNCANGGVCVESPGEVPYCHCTPHHTGPRCETKTCAQLYESCETMACCNQCPCTNEACCNNPAAVATQPRAHCDNKTKVCVPGPGTKQGCHMRWFEDSRQAYADRKTYTESELLQRPANGCPSPLVGPSNLVVADVRELPVGSCALSQVTGATEVPFYGGVTNAQTVEGQPCAKHSDCCNSCVVESEADSMLTMDTYLSGDQYAFPATKTGECGQCYDPQLQFDVCVAKEDNGSGGGTCRRVHALYGRTFTAGDMVDSTCSDWYFPPNHGGGSADEVQTKLVAHVRDPPECNGWGYKEGGACVCHPSRTGANCETHVCLLPNSVCSDEQDGGLPCCPGFDPTTNSTTLQYTCNGTCVPKT